MQILLYCLAIVVVSLLGGSLPLWRRVTHIRLQIYLSVSAGAMLGAAFFHMLPEAAELAGGQFGVWTAFGVVGLYMVERFLSPHSHEAASGSAEDVHEHEHAHDHDHAHANGAEPRQSHGATVRSQPPEHPHRHGGSRAAAPQIAGWSAFAGLSIHTLLGGVALGSAVLSGHTGADLGLAVFLATLLHKPADALTISALLVKGGTARRWTVVAQGCFSLLIPLGVLLFYFGQKISAGGLSTVFTGCVLAFSAGTFLCIALADLLPEVQFHSHDRGRLFLAVLFGGAVMWATSFAEHSDGHDHSSAPTPAAADQEHLGPGPCSAPSTPTP